MAFACGHYYANPRNRFWALLAASGLTAERLEPECDVLLPALGMGLLDVVDRPTPSAAELDATELVAGGARVRAELARWRPAWAAYTGKGVYRAVAGHDPAGYGPTGHPVVDGVADFVLPSPSGRSGLPWAVKVGWYRQLAELLPLAPR